MKKITYLIFAIIIGVGFSCEENQPLLVKHTRFSIAYIQEVDTDGAQFAANVYEYGTEEIIEYGFVFNTYQYPTISNSDVVKQSGKPDQLFTLKATHAMKLGATYYVAAYVKTQNGITYSKTEKFTSKGSVGFLVEKIEIPNPAYFGDTITIRGKNFSRLRTNYEVEIESARALVTEVGDDFMKFTIPSNIVFSENQDAFITTIKVAEKEFRAELKISFRDPVFTVKSPHKVNYLDTVFVEGQYLEGGDFEIQYEDPFGGVSKIPVVSEVENTFGFRPSVEFFETKPKIMIKVRGKKHSLQVFELAPTEFVPGQHLLVTSNQRVSALAYNLNPFDKRFNKLVSTDVPFWSLIENNEVIIHLDIPYKRELLEIYFENQGVRGKVPLKLTYKGPAITLMQVQIESQYAKSISINGRIYILNSEGIYELQPMEKKLSLLKPYPDNVFYPWNSFFSTPEGKIYLLSKPDDYSTTQHFHRFDPQSKQWTALAPLPIPFWRSKVVFATSQYIYIETLEYNNSSGEYYPPALHRFDIAANRWEILPSTLPFINNLGFSSFYYKENLYGIALDVNQRTASLLQFFPATENWKHVKNFGYYGGPLSNELLVIGDHVYGSFGAGLVRYSMNNEIEKLFPFLGSNNDYSKLSTLSSFGNKLFVLSGVRPIVLEYDPAYFPN